MHTINKSQLKKMNEVNEEDFVLLNVLPKKDFNEKHIRTSINVPQEREDFAEAVEMIAGGKNRKIVVYCASFDCNASSKAAQKLNKAGFNQVFDYEGGTKDWFGH